ncbi:MAG: homocitrate synthase/isopropylmalate synthase family protein, partial [Sarcina sp.]
MKNKKIYIFDSTLRDGAQAQGISFSVEDKLKICNVLDLLKVDYIEAGNPISNPKDAEFFQIAQELNLKHSKLVAFGSTRKPEINVKDDDTLKSLIDAKTKIVSLFGKGSKFQVKEILKTSLDENLKMIKESIEFLIKCGKDVIFDSEHFFDGYIEDKEYALSTLIVAKKAGAKIIVLCDTNGARLPNEIFNITKEVIKHVEGEFGIHCHNDMGLAVANSINAVEAGVTHIQGTFLGIGERCGNANLSTIIPIIKFNLDLNVLNNNSIKELTSVCRYISEVSNIKLREDLPYVGSSAFAHKGGMHIDAVGKNPKSYEHISPDLVGNSRRFLVSEV